MKWMSKGFGSISDFNITCKKCGSNNVDAEETDGYIYLSCNQCEKKKIYEAKEKKYGKIPDFIKRLLDKDKKAYNELIIQSEESLPIFKDLYTLLNDDLTKGEKEGYSGGIVTIESSKELIENATQLCNKVIGKYIINYYYEHSKEDFHFEIYLLKEVRCDESNHRWYVVNATNYCLEVKDGEVMLGEDSPINDMEVDTLLISGELEYHIEYIAKSSEELKKIFKNNNLL